MNYEERAEFILKIAQIIKELGGQCPGWSHDNEEINIGVGVEWDEDYSRTKEIMKKLQDRYGGEIQYHEYWESEGFISVSQASLIIKLQGGIKSGFKI